MKDGGAGAMSLTPLKQRSRNRHGNLGTLASLVLTANLAGFQAISFIPSIFGIDRSAATVPFRAVVLLFVIYVIYKLIALHCLRGRVTLTTLLVLSFWFAYSIRFMIDSVIVDTPMYEPAWVMALFIFGIIIPIFTVCYLIGDIELYKKALPLSMLLLLFSCTAAMNRGSTDSDIEKHGRSFGNDVLNPISYGHMGVTAVILGLFVLLKIGGTHRSWILRVMGSGSVCIGVFTILASGSRGATVAAMVLVPISLYLAVTRGSRLMTLAICGAGILTGSFSLGYLSTRGMDVGRLVASGWAFSSGNASTYERQNLIRDALQQYADHPLFGSAIVERNSLMYPHNAIVEAFMATGTFFGAIFTILVLISVYRAIRLTGRNPGMAWVPLCFFQSLIGAMFSGGLYQNPVLWGMMAIMLGVDMPANSIRKAERWVTIASQKVEAIA